MTEPATVVVISDEEDTTASRVAAELAVRGTAVAMIDAADFPTRLSLAVTNHSENWNGSLVGETSDGRPVQVDLADVISIYYRKPTQFQLAEGMSGPEQIFAYKEARRGFGGVLQALDCLWVNDPVRAAAAEYKPVQLVAAKHCGLNVPKTTITNDPAYAHAWAKELGGPLVYKPLGGAFHSEGGQVKVNYTARIDDPDEVHDPAVALTAHLFQEWVDKDFEARAVVVGDQVFTAAIRTGSEAAFLDWRADYDALTYETITPPDAVRQALVQLHRQLGLVYGAVDLAITRTGEWVFYETNPAGQYGWLVQKCGLPVASALAAVLQKGQA